MTTLRDDMYTDLVVHFYVNAYREYGEISIESYVKEVSFTLDRSVIRKKIGIRLDEKVYRDNVSQKEQLKVLYGQKMDECIQPNANDLPFELTLVHHFACTIFTPETGKYGYVYEKELFFFWAYITNSKIDLYLFILDHMFKATIARISLPYGIFLIKVFKFFKIDLNNEKMRTPKSISDEYNEKTLKRIGYIIKNNKWTPKPIKKIGEGSA